MCFVRLTLRAGTRTRFAVCLSNTVSGRDAIAQYRQKLFSSTMHVSEYCFSLSEHKECVPSGVIPEREF